MVLQKYKKDIITDLVGIYHVWTSFDIEKYIYNKIKIKVWMFSVRKGKTTIVRILVVMYVRYDKMFTNIIRQISLGG